MAGPRDRDFRLLVGAIGLSALGDWVAIVALGLHMKEVADSGLVVAALWVCLFGPSVAGAGLAGLLVDRVEATRVLAGVSALGALGAAALAGSGDVGPVLALTALLGLVFAVSQPAEFALVPLLAGERSIRAANGQVETVRYVGYALGPVLGGILFAVGGLGLAMLADAATFAAVAGAALALRVRRSGAGAEAQGAPRARDGIVFLLRDRVLYLAMLVAFGSLLFMSAVWVGELFFVEDVLGRGDVAYGLMLSVWTVGMALGAMLLSRRVAAGATAIAALGAVAIQGLALALPAAFLGFPFFLACMFMGGLAHGVKNVLFRSLIHLRVPDSLHGRAFAAYNGIRNSAELAAFAAGGLLIAVIGARGTVAYAGGLAAIVGLAGLTAMLRMFRGWHPTGPIGPARIREGVPGGGAQPATARAAP
jgi:Major Facilitator Superfamily